MMKTLKHILILITIVILNSSCEKLFIKQDIDNTPRANFNYLWQQVYMGYSFFDVKEVNWDSVYYQYSPLITDDMTDEQLFDVLAQMMNELHDGHVNLYSPFKTSKYDVSMLGNVNIDFRVIKDNYLGEDYIITGPFIHDSIENMQIGYIRYASFSNSVTSVQLDYIMNRYAQTKGLIFDIRQNGGGYIDNVFMILNRFVTEKTLLYTTQIKTGYLEEAQQIFSDPVAVYAYPVIETLYTKPIIVLTDRGSYSATSFFAVGCKAIPNITLVGDTTGGGLGLPNGGQLPNGWTYRFSVSRTLCVEGFNWENGVPPDYYEVLAPDYNITGEDAILNKAIDLILN